MLSFCKSTSYIQLGPIHTTSLYFKYLFIKVPPNTVTFKLLGVRASANEFMGRNNKGLLWIPSAFHNSVYTLTQNYIYIYIYIYIVSIIFFFSLFYDLLFCCYLFFPLCFWKVSIFAFPVDIPWVLETLKEPENVPLGQTLVPSWQGSSLCLGIKDWGKFSRCL